MNEQKEKKTVKEAVGAKRQWNQCPPLSAVCSRGHTAFHHLFPCSSSLGDLTWHLHTARLFFNDGEANYAQCLRDTGNHQEVSHDWQLSSR